MGIVCVLLMTVATSRSVGAGGLISSTKCAVQALLTWTACPTPVSTPPKATPRQSSSTHVPASPDSSGSSLPTAGLPSTPPKGQSLQPAFLQPVAFNEALRQPLPQRLTSGQAEVSSRPTSSLQANVFSVAANEGQAINQVATPVERTALGWKIFGVVWYWWLALAGGFIGAIAYGVTRVRWSKRALEG